MVKRFKESYLVKTGLRRIGSATVGSDYIDNGVDAGVDVKRS
jgi:hypothetical protein